MKNRWRTFNFFISLVLALWVSVEAPTCFAEDAQVVLPHSDWTWVDFGLIPVQNGGRVKPFDSFARETVLFMTGSRKWQRWEAVDLLLSWIAHPEYWTGQALIQVNREDVRRQLNLNEKQTRFSPHELFTNASLMQYAQRMGQGQEGSKPPGAPRAHPRDQELQSVLGRLGTFHTLISGQGWLLIPKSEPKAWDSLVSESPEGKVVRSTFVETLKAYQQNEQGQFKRATVLLRAAIEGEIPRYEERFYAKIQAESFYNRVRPFGVAWVFYLLSGLVWILIPTWKKTGQCFLGVAFLCHSVGMGLRCFVAGRPPVTNMYESMIWVSFGVVVFALILDLWHRKTGRKNWILAVASILALFGLIAGDAAPALMDPSLNPLVPVLRSNYWLTIHVLTITLSYAAFALTFGLGNFALYQFLRKETIPQARELNQLAYRAMQFGVVLIAAGTILGGIWADYSWGRFWGWDPKEVWALITLLCYLIILHGRFTNWVGPFGFAVLATLSFLSVIMAWYGVNFVLGVGLHSYGFSSGGTGWVLGCVGLELCYVLSVVYWVKRRGNFA